MAAQKSAPAQALTARPMTGGIAQVEILPAAIAFMGHGQTGHFAERHQQAIRVGGQEKDLIGILGRLERSWQQSHGAERECLGRRG